MTKSFFRCFIDSFRVVFECKKPALESSVPVPCACGYLTPTVVRDRMKYDGRTIFFVTCLCCNRSGSNQISTLGAIRAWNDQMKGE